MASVALTQREAAPPSIAEFAPQAVEQIIASTEPAAGGRGGSSADTSLSDAESDASAQRQAAIEVARVRQCVGDPPRQIEDPQSPPCVPYWSGDNGGSTYQGVTRDEIRIAAPSYASSESYRNRGLHYLDRLAGFFSSRFELYGRRIRMIDNTPRGDPQAKEIHQMQAIRADEELNAFASSQWRAGGGFFYHDELARRAIPNVSTMPLWSDERLSQLRPYTWAYPMAIERMFAHIGEWTCKRLAGGHAAHAGGLERGRPRIFGMILQYQFQEQRPPLDSLHRELASCGASPRVTIEDQIFGTAARQSFQAMVLRMKEAGVTSLLCLCDVSRGMNSLQQEATLQGWFPEWLASTYVWGDTSVWTRVFGMPGQVEHLFGLTFHPKEVGPHDSPPVWALREMDPDLGGVEDGLFFHDLVREYRALLLLASGIQMAGPHLTPETFANGLHKTRFPNPAHRIMAGDVGFEDGDYTMTDDGAEFWWSRTDKGPLSDDAGTVCYVAGGARHRKGNWPGGQDPFFRPPCNTA